MIPVDTENSGKGPAAAVLMASGFSKRFGKRNKLLVPFRGKPLARHTLELAAALGFPGGVFFVVSSDDVAALASGLPGVRVIKNAAPDKGLRESVRLGVEAAGERAAYCLFFPCDQPFLDNGTVRLILDAREEGRIVEPCYRGRPGNPCLFSSAFLEELVSLKEGETPRLIKTRHPDALVRAEVPFPLVLEDVDDEQTLQRLEAVSIDKKQE
jgi:molybdenum cofactor cytidylyltransferase